MLDVVMAAGLNIATKLAAIVYARGVPESGHEYESRKSKVEIKRKEPVFTGSFRENKFGMLCVLRLWTLDCGLWTSAFALFRASL